MPPNASIFTPCQRHAFIWVAIALATGQLFGFFGVLIALPVSATLSVAWRELRRSYLSSALYKN